MKVPLYFIFFFFFWGIWAWRQFFPAHPSTLEDSHLISGASFGSLLNWKLSEPFFLIGGIPLLSTSVKKSRTVCRYVCTYTHSTLLLTGPEISRQDFFFNWFFLFSLSGTYLTAVKSHGIYRKKKFYCVHWKVENWKMMGFHKYPTFKHAVKIGPNKCPCRNEVEKMCAKNLVYAENFLQKVNLFTTRKSMVDCIENRLYQNWFSPFP